MNFSETVLTVRIILIIFSICMIILLSILFLWGYIRLKRLYISLKSRFLVWGARQALLRIARTYEFTDPLIWEQLTILAENTKHIFKRSNGKEENRG